MMKASTHLVTDLSRLRVRPKGPAIAGVWFTTGDSAFPAQGWTDFVVVVLGWWADALLRILRGDTLNAVVHFMDGPFLMEVSLVNSKLAFKMLDTSGGGNVVATGEAFSTTEFIGDLVEQSRFLLKECRAREWWSSDADVLAQRVDDLLGELKRSR